MWSLQYNCFSLVVFHISDKGASQPPEVIPPCCLERPPGWRWFHGLQTEQDKQGEEGQGYNLLSHPEARAAQGLPFLLLPKAALPSPSHKWWIQQSCGRLKILSLQGWSSASLQNKGVGVGVGKSGSSDCSNKSKLPGTILPKARRGHEGFGAVSQPLCKSYTTLWLK